MIHVSIPKLNIPLRDYFKKSNSYDNTMNRESSRLIFEHIGAGVNFAFLSIRRNHNLPIFSKLDAQLNVAANQVKDNLIYDMVPLNIKDTNNFDYEKIDRILKLNDLYSGVNKENDYIVVADDDCFFYEGGLLSSIGIMKFFEFDLAQISHSKESNYNYRISRQEAETICRQSRFVEIGPLLIVRRNLFPEFFPFWYSGMGWGLEAYWAFLADSEKRKLGIIDLDSIVHAIPASNKASYIDLKRSNLNFDYYRMVDNRPDKVIIKRFFNREL